MGFAETLAETVKQTEARILVIDIETRPHVVYAWGLWDQNVAVSQIVERGGVICFAAKWYADPKITFRSVHHDGHEEMIAEAWRLMDEADIIVGYNHRAFDIKHLHREFILAGLGPPSPHKDIDLLMTARRRFKFPSNKLDNVARELGVGFKVQHSGFDLWRGCMDGDDKAWRTMKTYNRHDVVLTEEVYDRLRPWVPNHPNLNMYRGLRVSACHACGSDKLEDAGFHYTQSRAYPQFRCCQCGGYSRATHSEPTRTMHRRGSA